MKKNYLFITIILFGIAIFSSSAFAQPSTQVNYTAASSGLSLTQLNYQPYPANPGEYFDLWIQAQYITSNSLGSATFQLMPTFPFSLDPNESATMTFTQINGYQPLLIHYKIRVDSNAVNGDNELDLGYYVNGDNRSLVIKKFDIQVTNAQTDFDVVMQESTATDVSLGIANIGENTANSLIVRIPDQSNYRITGTNAQIVGNLNAGDYSIASFSLVPTRRGANNTLEVQMDYTDNIGVRRSVIKNVDFVSTSPVTNGTLLYGGGNFTRGNFAVQKSSGSILTSGWFWLAVILIIGGGFYIKKNPEKVKGLFSKVKKEEKKLSSKYSKEIPEWVSSERKKKR